MTRSKTDVLIVGAVDHPEFDGDRVTWLSS
jgi:hypothetical protein